MFLKNVTTIKSFDVGLETVNCGGWWKGMLYGWKKQHLAFLTCHGFDFTRIWIKKMSKIENSTAKKSKS